MTDIGLRDAVADRTPPRTTRRVVGLVDTDSFAKWGAHLLSAAPAGWDLELLTVATPRSASTTQLRSAFQGVDARLARHSVTPPAARTVDEVVERLRVDPPDALLVSTIGPVAELLIDEVHRRVHRRPVIISGLPGISFPAKWKGIFLRARADLFVLHSHREVREYRALAIENGVEPHFTLATLPFARATSAAPTSTATTSTAHTRGTNTAPTNADRRPARDSVVFAAQPSVPALPEERRAVVDWLARTAAAHPEWRVVIKTRAASGEQQTHLEPFPYADLVPADAPANLVVEGGSMAAHLDRAVALVTISSTAVLEAAARGVPALTLTDFGTSRKLINEVFVGSGLEGTSDDLVAGRFGTVRAEWMADNYFHPASDDDWAARVEQLMRFRDAGALEARPAARRNRGGALRRAWERRIALGDHDRSVIGGVAAAIGTPIRKAKRVARRVRRRLRPAVAEPTSAG